MNNNENLKIQETYLVKVNGDLGLSKKRKSEDGEIQSQVSKAREKNLTLRMNKKRMLQGKYIRSKRECRNCERARAKEGKQKCQTQ